MHLPGNPWTVSDSSCAFTASNRLSSTGTARSAALAVGRWLIAAYRNSEKTASNGGNPGRIGSRVSSSSLVPHAGQGHVDGPPYDGPHLRGTPQRSQVDDRSVVIREGRLLHRPMGRERARRPHDRSRGLPPVQISAPGHTARQRRRPDKLRASMAASPELCAELLHDSAHAIGYRPSPGAPTLGGGARPWSPPHGRG